MENPAIYVADLAAYNNGILHGIWIDATQEVADIWQAVQDMLKATPLDEVAEEWAIHDYMNFGPVQISEYQSFESAHALALFIEEHGELGAAVLEEVQGDVDTATRVLEEDYIGEYQSLADYAEQLTEDTSDIPEAVACYIDYKAMGRDMALAGEVFTIEMGWQQVHIFWNR